MRESELDRCKEEAKAPRKPFADLTNRHYPLRGLDRAGVPGCFPDVAMAAGLAGLCLPSVRTAQVNRRVASDPLPGKQRGTEEQEKTNKWGDREAKRLEVKST